MNRAIYKICEWINKIYEGMALILLVAMTIALALQVFTRYILEASMAGTEEFARYAFIWVIMLGASICTRTGGHATVTILNDHLKGNVKKVHQLIIEILVMICCLVLLRYGFTMIEVSAKSHTPTLGIPTCVVYASLPVGCFGMIVGTVSNILSDMMDKNTEEVEG
ncbi:hypothetical protein B5E84_14995 [Lachnoclostridium sp. An14]|uniref:TRAP transporter small permease n=1 Tax=Lachnoclostridium sp. An14 TaxID=1965562 RepID=UPI000B387FC7|nr:TRAP transporter small permease [Lachnoclostridium sp. An14]OUQ15401.1 hypothetical protein B5E84_14995 [Lachnoclostridium sp. An14]